MAIHLHHSTVRVIGRLIQLDKKSENQPRISEVTSPACDCRSVFAEKAQFNNLYLKKINYALLCWVKEIKKTFYPINYT